MLMIGRTWGPCIKFQYSKIPKSYKITCRKGKKMDDKGVGSEAPGGSKALSREGAGDFDVLIFIGSLY